MTSTLVIALMIYWIINLFALGFLENLIEDVNTVKDFKIKHLVFAVLFIPATLMALLIFLCFAVYEISKNFFRYFKSTKLSKWLNKPLFGKKR